MWTKHCLDSTKMKIPRALNRFSLHITVSLDYGLRTGPTNLSAGYFPSRMAFKRASAPRLEGRGHATRKVAFFYFILERMEFLP